MSVRVGRKFAASSRLAFLVPEINDRGNIGSREKAHPALNAPPRLSYLPTRGRPLLQPDATPVLSPRFIRDRESQMFRSMIKEIVDLLDEADEARLLATEMTDAASVQDLLKYAAALEADASRLGSDWAKESSRERADEPRRVLVSLT